MSRCKCCGCDTKLSAENYLGKSVWDDDCLILWQCGGRRHERTVVGEVGFAEVTMDRTVSCQTTRSTHIQEVLFDGGVP